MNLKEVIEQLKPIQMDGKDHPCPRCGAGVANTRSSLSRYADVMICDRCGNDEAMQDYFGHPPRPFRDWNFSAALRELGGGEDA